jgi:hypothetical protein
MILKFSFGHTQGGWTDRKADDICFVNKLHSVRKQFQLNECAKSVKAPFGKIQSNEMVDKIYEYIWLSIRLLLVLLMKYSVRHMKFYMEIGYNSAYKFSMKCFKI